MSLLGKAI